MRNPTILMITLTVLLSAFSFIASPAQAQEDTPANATAAETPSIPSAPKPAPSSPSSEQSAAQPKLPDPGPPPKPVIDEKMAASTERWVALTDAERQQILDKWRALPEDNRPIFILYRDQGMDELAADAKKAGSAAAKPNSVNTVSTPAAPVSEPAETAPAAAEDESAGGVKGLIEKIF